MKPALVLGLALAANAMVADQGDNELFVAPTGKLAEFAKRHPEIKFDEQADDELLVRPIYAHPVYAQVAVDDELLVREMRPIQHADDELMRLPTHNIQHFDDELMRVPRHREQQQLDDEFIIAPTDEFGRIKHYPPYIKFDEDGNEFFVAPTHRLGDIGHRILYDDELAAHASNVKELLEKQFEFKGRLDDEVDTELMRAPYQRRHHDDIEGRKVYDDEADAELMMAPLDGTGKYNRRVVDAIATRKVYDDEADSELMTSAYRKKYDDFEGRRVYDDELLVGRPFRHQQQVDDELSVMKPRRISQQVDDELTVMRHPFHRQQQQVDDELLVRSMGHIQRQQHVDDELIIAPTDEFVRIKKFPGRIMYDEVDDELLAKTDIQRHHQQPNGVKPKLFIERQAEALRRRDDEELFSRKPVEREVQHPKPKTMGSKLFVQRQAEALRRDDEGDDELVYLGDLLSPFCVALFKKFSKFQRK